MCADVTVATGELASAGSSKLKVSLRKAEAKKRRTAFMLTLPLLAFITVMFLVPLLGMVWLSVANTAVRDYMPKTVSALATWDGKELPPEKAYAAVGEDLTAAFKARTFGRVAKRLNEEMPGVMGVINKTSFRSNKLKTPPASWKDELIKIDPKWGQMPIWNLLKRQSSMFTADYYLAAIDMQVSPTGHIERVPSYERIYIKLFIRTAWMSALVTVLTLVLGYPLAYWISRMPASRANLMMIAVLLPFWTSLLVRITAWIVLLQSHGVVNSLLVESGMVAENARPQLINNALGTVIVMTQVLLPFMVLPLYSVMRSIPDSYMRAAVSMGAHPWRAFWRVFAPLTVSGVGAGVLLVFILSIGYYITPELVGGQNGQFISNRIAYNVQQSLNWGLAAALGTILTVVTLILFLIYGMITGKGKVSIA
ncbi:permease [Allgaiera indica]|uniref:Permease n=1 Tax=Allgaiera indica TaxID=765699 RepID=A0AAN5A027_9RHOB|nr:permease [Allgaiera indica]SDX25622.1 putative spermidine/putrescine transport system permease protein [Allgaiera indica]